MLFTFIRSSVPPATGVLPGAGVTGVAPPVDGVLPELPGAGVVGVVPPVEGVLPELPGAVVVPPVVPAADGVFPELPGAGVATDGVTGVATTLDFTGVVARVTSVADLRTTAGVGLDCAAALVAFPPPDDPPPPDPPPEAAVQRATQVSVAAGIVKLVPADNVDPLLQLQPAKVNPDFVNPVPLARLNVAPLALSDSVGAVPERPSNVYVTE